MFDCLFRSHLGVGEIEMMRNEVMILLTEVREWLVRCYLPPLKLVMVSTTQFVNSGLLVLVDSGTYSLGLMTLVG
jgi:hypothetical protein